MAFFSFNFLKILTSFWKLVALVCIQPWVDPKLAEIWRKQVGKTRGDVFNPVPGASGIFVCSNHFPVGRRTPENPKTDYPSIFMTVFDYLQKKIA